MIPGYLDIKMKEIRDEIEIVTASAGRGAAWLTEALSFFARSWENWVGMGIVFFVISLIATVIPLGSVVLNIFLPALLAGMMLACRAQEQGGDITIRHLFAGFSNNLGQHILLGVFYSVSLFVFVIVIIIFAIIILAGMGILNDLISTGMDVISENISPSDGLNIISENVPVISIVFLISILVGLMLYIPFLMAFWFAPALIALDDQTALAAMKNSFFACVKNIVPYFIYGIVGLVFTLLATIPLALGWLVLFPVIVISIYLSYVDVFKKIPAVEVI